MEVLFSCRYEDSNISTGNGKAGKGPGQYEGFESVFVSHAAAEVSVTNYISLDALDHY